MFDSLVARADSRQLVKGVILVIRKEILESFPQPLVLHGHEDERDDLG
jgi:hypothetical protein